MEREESKYLDLKQVLSSKNKKLAQWMPGFLLSYFKRIVHEKDLNALMAAIGDKEGLDFVNAGLDYLDCTVAVKGLENVPKEGGVIIASNHPLGGLDGIALMSAIGRVRPDIQFLVNDILLNIENLQPLFIPVNKVGVNPRKALEVIEETYAKEVAILVFPAGLVSRQLTEGIADLTWQKSFIAKAKKYQKDIVPVHIQGRNSNFFYQLSKWRRKLGVKANIEMLYLADEMFRQRGKTITITIGGKVPYTHFDERRTLQEWAAEMRRRVYDLAPKE